MGTGMGTRLYSLPGEDVDGTKVWYPLDLGMGMGMNFFYEDGYGIAKLIPASPRCHPYSRGWKKIQNSRQNFKKF